MNKLFFILLMLLLSIAAHAVTLTRDSTDLVSIPVAIRADVCQWDEEAEICTGPNQEVIFGHALVYPVRDPPLSENVDIEIFVFNNEIYRSMTINPRTSSNLYTEEETAQLYEESNGEPVLELENIIGLFGRLSRVNPDGTEDYGEFTEPLEDTTSEKQNTGPSYQGIGTFEVTYSGGREGIGRRTPDSNPFEDLTADSYEDLELTIDGQMYKLQNITSYTEDLQWRAGCTADADCNEGQICDEGACKG